MNIFVVDRCPRVCAQRLDSGRVVKMIVETAQLLSTAIHLSDAPEELRREVYRPTHTRHPCAIWARETQANYTWLLAHLVWLLHEYEKESGKLHKTERIYSQLYDGLYYMPEGEQTGFPNCTPHKALAVHEAYGIYMYEKWQANYNAGLHHRYYSSSINRRKDYEIN